MPVAGLADERRMISRPIPASDERLPVIGLGTYSVFDVESTPGQIATSREIVELLLGAGGNVIDTSPMYNRSEKVIGDIIASGAPRDAMFIATKVWTDGRNAGIEQMSRSARLMNTDVIDLMQVHNLRDSGVHMRSIRELQEQGKIRYSGLTHYRAGAHDALEKAVRDYRPQFLQINYSLSEREADQRLLPMAQDLGVGVIVNRPYQAGGLFSAVRGRKLPEWAGEFAASWGQFFLKFIISHPAVTCVIPATSKPQHMRDNLTAGLLRRIAAILYDSLLLLALWFLATLPFIATEGGESIEPGSGPMHIVYQLTLIGVAYGFFVGFWCRRGRTLGMQSWGLQLQTADGKPPSVGAATLRFFTAILSWLPLGLGFLWQLWDTEQLTWHDRLSRTRLVYYPRKTSPG
jgi:diketogulonate reductase-like aldo/keto reductase